MTRPSKFLRLNYWQMSPEFGACIGVLGGPNEIILQATQKSFISIKEDVLTLSGGFPSKINIQGMPESIRYGGMLQDLPFPLSLVPSTIATPMPRLIIVPPFMGLLPQLTQLASVASVLL